MSRWKIWKRDTKRIDRPTGIGRTYTAKERLQTLERRKYLLKWRDEQEARIESVLRSNVPALKEEARRAIEAIPSWRFFFVERRGAARVVGPIVSDWAAVQTVDILQVASGHGVEVLQQCGGVQTSELSLASDKKLNQVTDLVKGVGPTAAGFLAIPATMSASAVSAGGILGFFGATTVLWPVAVLGALFSVVMLVTGGFNSYRLRAKANKRAYRNACRRIDEVILEGSEGQPSLKENLQQIIWETAREQLS
ncbi:MAG: hypothetical protein AAF583_03175 [Pseudomonadota bacterium]